MRCSWLWCVWEPVPIMLRSHSFFKISLKTPSFSPGVCDRKILKVIRLNIKFTWCQGKDCPEILCEKCPEYNPQRQVVPSPFHERIGKFWSWSRCPSCPVCPACPHGTLVGESRKCWDEIIWSQEMWAKSMVIRFFVYKSCFSLLVVVHVCFVCVCGWLFLFLFDCCFCSHFFAFVFAFWCGMQWCCLSPQMVNPHGWSACSSGQGFKHPGSLPGW